MSDLFRIVGLASQGVVHASWHGGILIAIIMLLQWGLRNRLPARWLAALWLVALVRLLMPAAPESRASLFNLSSLVSLVSIDRGLPRDAVKLLPPSAGHIDPAKTSETIVLPSASDANELPLAATAGLSESEREHALQWQVIGGVWLLGVFVVVIRMMGAIRALGCVLSSCEDIRDSRIVALFSQCLAEMGVSRTVRLVVSQAGMSPAVTAFGRRTWLILPERLLTTLTPNELRMVFLHELAHLRRADVLLHGLWTLVVALHWFNPAVWLARFRVQADRELASDEEVLSAIRPDERTDYGQAILKVVEILSPPTPMVATVGAFSCQTLLKRRITMICNYRRTSRSWALLAGSLFLGLSLVGLTDAVGEPQPASQPSANAVRAKAEQPAAKTTEPSDAKSDSGTLYLNAVLKVNDPQGETKNLGGIIQVDVQSGAWKTLMDRGHSPRVSLNGESLAFSDDEGTWSCDAKEALSPGKLADVSGRTSWMPDGKHLVVTSALTEDNKVIDEKGWECQTWLVRADGGPKSPLPIPSSDFVEDVSPDGKWFVTSSDRHPPHGRGYQLYVMRPDGTEQLRLTKEGLNVYARFSPDSRRILYLFQNRDGNKLRVVNIDGSGEETIASEAGVSNSVDHAAWSPDGKRIAVIRYDWQTNEKGRRVLDINSDANYRIEIVDADGGQGRVLELKDAKASWLGGSIEWR